MLHGDRNSLKYWRARLDRARLTNNSQQIMIALGAIRIFDTSISALESRSSTQSQEKVGSPAGDNAEPRSDQADIGDGYLSEIPGAGESAP